MTSGQSQYGAGGIVWRIGQLAGMAGVSQRTLRHYDKVGLLAPAACDQVTGYRWYGVAELVRLERIRGLRRLGLPLHQIADLLDAPEPRLRQAVAEAVTRIRGDIAALTLLAESGEDHLATPLSILPQRAAVGMRRLSMRYFTVAHPSELAAACAGAPVLLTWLRGQPTAGFTAAVATSRGGERITLPARDVVRAVVPATTGIVRAGNELFRWLDRHRLAVAGPTLEERLVDADGAQATVIEIPVRAVPSPGPTRLQA